MDQGIKSDMVAERFRARREAYLLESETTTQEVQWIGLFCDWIGCLSSCEDSMEMMKGAGQFMRRYAKRRLAVDSYFWGRGPSDENAEPELRAEWARLHTLYPQVPPLGKIPGPRT